MRRTAVNQARGFLLERGVPAAKGECHADEALFEIRKDAGRSSPICVPEERPWLSSESTSPLSSAFCTTRARATYIQQCGQNHTSVLLVTVKTRGDHSNPRPNVHLLGECPGCNGQRHVQPLGKFLESLSSFPAVSCHDSTNPRHAELLR
jgi:hypothetical protein